MSEHDKFEQQPFVAEATDEQIIRLARERYGNDTCEVDDDALVYRGDAGAWVDAVVFVPQDEIEQFGAYVLPAEEDIGYAPGPVVLEAMEQMRAEHIEDVRRAVNLGMMDYEQIQKQPKPLWERIASHFFTTLCVLACGFWIGSSMGENKGYKQGVADTFAATISVLKHINDEPDSKVPQ